MLVQLNQKNEIDQYVFHALFPKITNTYKFKAVQDPTLLDECNLDEKIKKVLLEQINIKLTQQAVKIRADIEVSV